MDGKASVTLLGEDFLVSLEGGTVTRAPMPPINSDPPEHHEIRRLLLPFFSPTLGGSAWNEAVDGDLSDDPSAPTAVVLTSGSNMIDGSVTTSAPADTRDYITFTIPPG